MYLFDSQYNILIFNLLSNFFYNALRVNILNDYKVERLKIALLGLRKHLDYRKLKNESKLNVVYDKYFHIVETNNISDGFQEYINETHSALLNEINF